MREIEFYQSHLDGGSRSFAFCIQKLNPPFRQWVSLSYLLCRVLDTVEDSIWPGEPLQDAQYAEFNSFMVRPPSPDAVLSWAARFPTSIPETEKRLLGDSYELFHDLHGLLPEVQTIIQ